MDDCLIIGGGVIGLSIAYELADKGLRVRILDQGHPGRAASWAGAGMLPPGFDTPAATPVERLAALSSKLYPMWSQELRETTGIDNGYRNCGAIYLARDNAAGEELTKQMQHWQAGDISCIELDETVRCELEPELLPTDLSRHAPARAAYLVASESQVRNPRHLKALKAGCRQRGVCMDAGTLVHDFRLRDGHVAAALTSAGPIEAGSYCLAAGAWSASLAARLGFQISIKPVRGQMVLLTTEISPLGRIVNEGPRYLVPRGDGRVLIGSTEEETGFDCRTTVGGVASLLQFGQSLVPSLASATIETSWAGLRPASADGLPLLGPISRARNFFVATGHFRHGWRLAPGTARVMGQLIRGERTAMDLSPFHPERKH